MPGVRDARRGPLLAGRVAPLAERVAAHQRAWLADAIEIDHGGIAARSLPRRFVDNLLTMIAAVF